MSKTTLRTYNREIENLIEQNQFEQAIAHARHILQFFPKHVHTYRLLGKAYLESQRYGDAADVFQRVLSAIPDDFVSHVGMSIIREDEGNLDEAIWHMERAFEIQPANGAIQGELRRLYGRRDGMEPPKVRLTRGALARMYLKGELYQQAIAELRAALAEDPQRPDLLTLLAQAYFLTGQRVEAADTCSALLKKTPYCLEANRILADILANTERAAEAQTYRQRAQALDPYAAHTSPAAPTPERVPDTAVSLEKLVWTPGQPVTGPQGQPEWAASLGVDIGAAAPQKEDLPDWLNEQPEKAATPEPVSPEAAPLTPGEPAVPPEETPEVTAKEDEIPDWMKEIGWGPSTGAAAETAAPEVEVPESPELPPEEIAPAEMPDWLQGIAPGEAPPDELEPLEGEEAEELPTEAPLTDSDVLSWLEETPPRPTDTVATWLEEEKPPLPEGLESGIETGESVEIPDWLKDLEKVEAEPEGEPVGEPEGEPDLFETPSEEAEVEPAPEEPAGLPDWLAGGAVATAAAQAAEAEELPDWLKGIGEPEESEAEPTSEVPEWLRETGSLEAPPEQPSEAVPEGKQSATEAEDEAFAWLESLAAKQGAQEALILKPEDRRETPPDWVLEAASEEPAESAPPQEPGAPEWPSAEEEVEAELGEPAEEIPDWLRGMESETQAEPAEAVQHFEAPAEELEAPAEAAPAEEIPEWLRGLEGETQAEPAEAVQHFEAPAEELEAPGEAAPAEEIPDWLRGLESETQAEPAEAVQHFEQPAEELEAPGEAAPAEEIPEWLRGPEEAVTPQAELEEATQRFEEVTEEPDALSEVPPAEEIPDWLRNFEGQAETQAEPGEAAQHFEELAEESEARGEATPDISAWQVEEQFEQSLAETQAEPAELPDWLRDIGPEAGHEAGPEAFIQPEEGFATEPVEAQEEGLEPAELPEWLAGYKPSGAVEPEGEVEPELEMLFGPQALATGKPELPSAEETPSPEGEPVAISDTQPTRVRPPTEMVPQPAEEEVPSVEATGEGIPEWLQGLGEEQPAGETTLEIPSEEPLPITLEEVPFEAPEFAEQPTSEGPLPITIEEVPFETPESAEQPTTEEPTEAAAEAAGVPLDDESAFAWLEGLAARQGAEQAMLLEPEERTETPPEWVQKAAEEAEVPSIEAISPEIQPMVEAHLPETPEEQVELPVSTESETLLETPSAPEEEPEAPFELLTPEETEPVAQFEPLTPEEVVPELQESPPELPSWLAGVEQEGKIEEELAWTPPEEAQPEVVSEAQEGPPVVEPFQPEETPPVGLDLNQAGLSELERLPGVGFTRAQSIITYRQAFGPFTNVDDLTNVAGFDQALVESLREKVNLGEVQPVEAVPETVDIYQVTLIQARNALIQGQTVQAIGHYNSLIKAQQALPDVIQDLNEALYRFPVEVSIWEALGDAHVRSGHLQDALDAYTKAEELIR